MSLLRNTALFAASLALASCKLAEAPFKMMSGLGQMLHVDSARTRSPADLRLEARDVHDALADGAMIQVEPQTAQPELVQR